MIPAQLSDISAFECGSQLVSYCKVFSDRNSTEFASSSGILGGTGNHIKIVTTALLSNSWVPVNTSQV